MAQVDDRDECPADLLTGAMTLLGASDAKGLQRLEELIKDFPMDARLHFLRGSLLAGQQRYGEAHRSMAEAVAIAPAYAIARFQLGFLELTSGDAAAAISTWGPLGQLPDGDPLRLFSLGLQHLIRDEFETAIGLLERGIAANTENPALNGDMRLIIDKTDEARVQGPTADEPTSSAHMLLQQYAAKSTKH